MEKLEVKLGDRTYSVLIENGLLADAPAHVAALAAGGRIAFVTDENVWRAHGEAFFKLLEPGGAFAVVLPPGEAHKTLEELGVLANAFAHGGLTREGLVCAMGGGVVGDLAGFAAATWMRGVRCVQIPTTLLAMVDSSVGGKTAVDIPAGKNLVGAFHQPSLVLVDPKTLKTLPVRELRSGMAEVVKYGAALSHTLLETLECMTTDGIGRNDFLCGGVALDSVIAACVRIKADIVAEDELDTGRRALLNFGHTFGHAIEARHGFETYTHGEAVAMGMRLAARYGEAVCVTEQGTAARIGTLLDAWGLSGAESPEELSPFMKIDKKSKGAFVELILLRRPGEAFVCPTSFAELEGRLTSL